MMKNFGMGRRKKRNETWKDRAWVKDSMLKKCNDQVYRSFVSDTQRKIYAVQKNSGEKENRSIYNKCYQINALNKFHFEKSLQMGGKDRLKLAHVEAVFYLMEKMLPLVADLDNVEPYSILSTAMVRNRQFFDLIHARMDKK